MKKNVSKVLSIIVLVFVLTVTISFPFACYADTYSNTSYGVDPDGWLGTGFTMNLPSGVESTSGKMVTNFGSVPYFLGRPLDYSYFYADTDLDNYGSNSTGFAFGTRYSYFNSVSSTDNWYNDATTFSDVYAFGGNNLRVTRSSPYATWESIYNRIGSDTVSANFNSLVTGVGGPVPSFTYYGVVDKSRFDLNSEYESTFDSLPKTLTLYQIMRSTFDYNSTSSENILQYDVYLSGHTVGVSLLDNGATLRQWGYETSLSTLSVTSAITISDVGANDDKFAYAFDQYYSINNSPYRVRKVSIDMQLIYDAMLDNAILDAPFDKLLYFRDFTFKVIPVSENLEGNYVSAYNHIDIATFINNHSSVPIVSVSLDYVGAHGDSYQHNIGDIGNNVVVVEGGGEGGDGGEIPATDFTGWLSDTLSTFFDTKLFGFFGLGDILFTCLAIVLVFLLLKFFAGG